MTSISANNDYLSSILASSQIAQASQVSGNSALTSTQSAGQTGASSNNYGSAFVLDLSSSNGTQTSSLQLAYDSSAAGGASASGSSSSNNSPFEQILAALTSLAGELSGGAAANANGTTPTFGSTQFDQFLTNLANGTTASSSSTPQLTAAQQQQLQGILAQFQNAPATPDTFKQVETALQQAGINVGHGGHHHHGGGGSASSSLASSSTTSTSPSSTTNATKAVNNTADADATALLSMMDSTTSTTPPIA